MSTVKNLEPVDSRRIDSEATRAHAQALLEDVLKRSGSLRFACFGTADGRLFAAASAEAHSTGERVAAMTSSLLALSESFAKDALRSTCTHSVVSTQHGAIVVVRVPHAGRGYMLSLGSDGSEVMALTLRTALDAADRLAHVLGRTPLS